MGKRRSARFFSESYEVPLPTFFDELTYGGCWAEVWTLAKLTGGELSCVSCDQNDIISRAHDCFWPFTT